MFDWLSKLFIERWLGSVVRHLTSTLGGALLAIGVERAAVDGLTAVLPTVLGGVVLWGVAQLTSLIEKSRKG